MKRRKLHLHIFGLVQGVSFRYVAREQARALGVTGWVRNRPDGSVELVAVGEEQALAALLEWARRGPLGARVDRIEQSASETEEEFERFTISE